MKYFSYRGHKVYLLSFEDVEVKDSTTWETCAQLMNNSSTIKIESGTGKDINHSETAAISAAKKHIDDHYQELLNYLPI